MNDLLARDEIDKHLRISYHKKLWIWTQNFTISFQHSFPSCFFVELQPVWWVYAQLSTLIKHQPVFHFHFALINRSRRCFPFHSWFILMPKRERFSFSFCTEESPSRKETVYKYQHRAILPNFPPPFVFLQSVSRWSENFFALSSVALEKIILLSSRFLKHYIKTKHTHKAMK